MQRVRGNERGMALAVAIFALVVVGALVAGALFLGTQEQRVGENQYRLQQSFGIAELGAPELMKQWDKNLFNAMNFYPVDTFHVKDSLAPGGTGRYGGYVFKLNRHLYLFDLTGRDTASRSGSAALRHRGGGARQRLGVLARLRPLQLPQNASLTTQGNVNIGGTAAVDGADHTPNASWTSCAPPDTSKAGVRIPTSGSVSLGGAGMVMGEPPVVKDPLVADSTFETFGDVTWAQLVNEANVVIDAGGTLATFPVTNALGKCDRTVPTNWGDGLNRAGPCGNYFPIIHIKGTGTTTLNTVQGQGILLVDGDLRVQGSYEFFGVTIIRGTMTTSGGGTSIAHFWGMVMAQNVSLSTETIAGKANLNYSKCAIIQALEWTGVGAMMRSRSFVSLY